MNKKEIIFISGLLFLVISSLLLISFTKKKNKKILIQGSFKAKNCDELHAFENTGGRMIGGMNTKVNSTLHELYKKGFIPQVTNVIVDINSDKMEVFWKVEIEKSKDGKAWLGLTSRGASGSDAITRAVSPSVGHDINTIKSKLVDKFEEPNMEIIFLKDILFNITNDGKVLGKCPIRQLFYVYTRPNLQNELNYGK